MADIRRLDGSPVDVEKLGRNEKIAQMLEWLTQENNEGRLGALAVVSLTPDGKLDDCWSWPIDKQGFPWGLAMIGALAQLQADLTASAKATAPTPPDAPDGDGA